MIPHPAEPALTLSPSIVLVRPDVAHAHIHQQLISAEKSDKVHPLGGLDDLLQNRLGYDGFNKRCFALMEGNDVLAAIYTYWTAPQNADAEWQLLPGKVHEILQEPSRLMSAPPKVVTFYSISSFASGGGKNLIGELHQAFTRQANPPILTTLSPFRSFGDWLEKKGRQLSDSVECMIQTAAECLTENIDGVQRFHLGNGAYIGAIQPFSNAAGTADAVDGRGIMINYRYPRSVEALQANRKDYKGGVSLPAASHIRSLLGSSLG